MYVIQKYVDRMNTSAMIDIVFRVLEDAMDIQIVEMVPMN